jgi:preprotein translocase subunit SecE
VAQSRRRNRDVEENLNEVVDSTDTDALDEADLDADDELADADLEDDDAADDLDDDEVDTDEDDEDEAVAKKDRKAKSKKPADEKEVKVELEDGGPGIFGRFGRFVREVVAELRKVIWPTRKDLVVYATVVIVFVAIMLTLVGTLDWAFARAVLWVFSGN